MRVCLPPSQTTTLVFDSGSFDGMLKKIKEFNGQLAADASVGDTHSHTPLWRGVSSAMLIQHRVAAEPS